MFDPVWDALVPGKQASLLQLLIERVDYDGQAREESAPPGGCISVDVELDEMLSTGCAPDWAR